MSRTLRSRFLALSFLAAAWISFPFCIAADLPPSTAETGAFFHCVNDNFDKWDTNHDTVLSILELDHAILDPSNVGNAACTLAALHAVQQKSAKADQDIAINRSTLESDQVDPLKSKLYLKYFKRAIKRLAEPKTDLFAAGSPHLDAIHQGKTGDCYFISSLGALVVCRPKEVMDMIHSEKDAYLVKFPGQATITVNRPSDAEFATYGDSGSDGIWLNVIEKAFAKMKITSRPDLDEDLMYDKISGGNPGSAITLLTGHKSRRLSFKVEEFRHLVRTEIAKALAENRLITTSVTTIKKDGKRAGHALALIGYDPQLDQVKIWNPWGTSINYKAVGMKMDHGLFTMPTEEWLNRFKSVSFELAE